MRLLLPLLAATAVAAEPAWPAAEALVEADGLTIYLPWERRTELAPLAAELAGRWRALRQACPGGLAGPAALRLGAEEPFPGPGSPATMRRLALVPLAGDPLGPGGALPALQQGGRALARIALTQRVAGWRAVLARAVGDAEPVDLLAMAVALLALPPADTAPPWWRTALVAWWEAESDGGARDGWRTLVRMVWRLEADALPGSEGWREGHARWPYDRRATAYGLAYGRFLAARHPGRLWAVAEAQAGSPMFAANGATTAPLGAPQSALLAEARAALGSEQHRDCERLAAAGLRQAQRLTPPGVQVHELAWLDDGTLAVRETEVLGAGERVVRRRADGTAVDEALFGGWDAGGVERDLRRTRDGALCGASAAGGPLTAPRAELRPQTDAGPALALRHGDRASLADGTAVAVGVRPGVDGGQELVVVRLADGTVLARHRPSDAAPWAPCVRPGADEVAWIERAERTSRLMTARMPGLDRPTVRWQVDGVLAAPAFTPDGDAIAVCSDHTGVFNAWLVPVAGDAPRALTNSTGGVLACAPSPDGGRFALIDHDRDGAYLGLLPAAGGAEPPHLDQADPPAGTPPPPPPAALPPPHRADGLADLRFLGVIPSTDAAGGGGQGLLGGSLGLGLRAHAGDPLRRLHVVAGLGLADGVAVGVARIESLHLAPLMLAAEVHRQAQTWDDAAHLGGRREDYHERLAGGRVEAWAGPFLGLALGLDDHAPLDDADGYPVSALAVPPPLVGSERYVEIGGAIDLRRERPLAIAPEDGVALSATFRHSGLGGDLERDRLVAGIEGTLATWRRAGHQLAARLTVGWSDGDEVLQGAFAVGGRTAASAAILRGYGRAVEATGAHLGGWSLAYRLPLWRPELGAGTQPLALRQVVAEGFFDAAKASSDRPFGDGAWYRAAGLQLSLDAEVWVLRLVPGVALARQLDGDRRWGAEFVLGGSLGP